MGFEEPHLPLVVLVRGTGVFPNIPRFLHVRLIRVQVSKAL